MTPVSREKPRRLTEVRGTPRSAAGSLWRSHRERRRSRSPLAFLTEHFWPWVKNYVAVMFRPRYPFPAYSEPASARPGVFTFQEKATVAMAGDWGTGTRSAFKVGEQIRSRHPDVTIHLGDVYYSGLEEEFEQYFLGQNDWPRGKSGTYLLNANHEMYSGGKGYFARALPSVGQKASYFALENRYWRIVAVDTGYFSRTFPILELLLSCLIRVHPDNLQWLKEVAFPDPTDRRPVILLSHHQAFSAFDTEYRRVFSDLEPFLDRVLLWFWGHEHRFAAYAPHPSQGNIVVRARCIGHGGMPIELGAKPSTNDRGLVCLDTREATRLDDEPIGYCGFSFLRFSGPNLTVEHVDENGNLLLEETWSQGDGKVLGKVTRRAPELTVLPGKSVNAIVES